MSPQAASRPTRPRRYQQHASSIRRSHSILRLTRRPCWDFCFAVLRQGSNDFTEWATARFVAGFWSQHCPENRFGATTLLGNRVTMTETFGSSRGFHASPGDLEAANNHSSGRNLLPKIRCVHAQGLSFQQPEISLLQTRFAISFARAEGLLTTSGIIVGRVRFRILRHRSQARLGTGPKWMHERSRRPSPLRHLYACLQYTHSKSYRT